MVVGNVFFASSYRFAILQISELNNISWTLQLKQRCWLFCTENAFERDICFKYQSQHSIHQHAVVRLRIDFTTDVCFLEPNKVVAVPWGRYVGSQNDHFPIRSQHLSKTYKRLIFMSWIARRAPAQQRISRHTSRPALCSWLLFPSKPSLSLYLCYVVANIHNMMQF